ncbi:MAG: DUF3068 domain-containing protein [Dermatophilaceae bacterium]
MRKVLAPLLLGIGGFLLTTALLVLLWVPGQVKKTPLDTNNTSRATGDAIYLGADRVPVKGSTHTVVDGQASTGDTVVFQTFSCLIKNPNGTSADCVAAEGGDSDLINASTEAFATNRLTGIAVSDQEKFLGADASPHEGLINKYPFDVQKKSYPFWDGILGRAVETTFQGEEKIQGLNTYKFNLKVNNEAAEISSGVQGTYSQDKTMWIDPVTGAIIDQVEHQTRILPDGTTALDLNLKMDDGTIKMNVDSAKSNGGKLGLVGRLPWIAGLLGLVATALGFVLMRRRGPDAEATPIEAPAQSTTPTQFGAPDAGTTAASGAAALPRTEAPLPRTEAPLPRTEATLPRTEAPLPRTEATLPRTEATVERTQPVPTSEPGTDQTLPRRINLEKD